MSEDLEDRITTMKREIDALQIAVTGQKKPWYKDMSTIISVVALAFSFSTTYVSYRRTEVQDIQNTRQELRGLLQRLSALPKENFENTAKYRSDPAAMGFIGGLINQENSLLARQAAELARGLPRDKVTGAEYYGIAVALGNSYDLKSEKEFLKLTEENAKDFNTEIGALRVSANVDFLLGHPEAGRVEYQRALDIFSKYPGYDPYTVGSTNVWTELSWAGSESMIGATSVAAQHIDSAERIAATLPPGQSSEVVRGQVRQARAQYNSGGNVTPPQGSGSQLVPAASK